MYIERLPESEELVMSVIWKSKEDLIAYEITDLVKGIFDRDWKPQTTLTILDRLKKKGFINSYKDKKKYNRIYSFFHAEITKEEYILERFKEIENIWFCGNKEEMKQFIENLAGQERW